MRRSAFPGLRVRRVKQTPAQRAIAADQRAEHAVRRAVALKVAAGCTRERAIEALALAIGAAIPDPALLGQLAQELHAWGIHRERELRRTFFPRENA